MSRAALGVALAFALSSTGRAQSTLDGMGRVSVLAGWKYTPNGFFEGAAAQAGFPVTSARHGGPMITGSFGYGATDSIDVDIDLIGGTDALSLSQFGDVHTFTYGILLGVRFQHLFTPSFWEKGLVPYVGLYTGPTIVDVTSGWFPLEESLVAGYAASAGALVFLSDRWALTLEAKVLIARGEVPGFGGINGGGAWMGLGLAWLVPRSASGHPSLSDRPLAE